MMRRESPFKSPTSRRWSAALLVLTAFAFSIVTPAHGQPRDHRRHAGQAREQGHRGFDAARERERGIGQIPAPSRATPHDRGSRRSAPNAFGAFDHGNTRRRRSHRSDGFATTPSDAYGHTPNGGGFGFAPHGNPQPFGSPNHGSANIPHGGGLPGSNSHDSPYDPRPHGYDPFVPAPNPRTRQPIAPRPIPDTRVPIPDFELPPFIRIISRPDYLIYEPPARSGSGYPPVVLYLHGFGGGELRDGYPEYHRLLSHLASRGYLVIFPLYQGSGPSDERFWDAGAWEGTCVALLREALTELRTTGRIRPDVERFAVAGHSMGGLLALRIANRPLGDVPTPRAIVLHDAAGFSFLPFLSIGELREFEDEESYVRAVEEGRYDPTWLDDLSGIDARSLLMLIVAQETYNDELAEHSDGDRVVFGNANAGGVWTRAWEETAVRSDRKHVFRVPGPHVGVHEDEYVDPYLRLTEEALRAGLSGAPLRATRLAGVEELPGFAGLGGPRPFEWNCGMVLDPESGITLRDALDVLGVDHARLCSDH